MSRFEISKKDYKGERQRKKTNISEVRCFSNNCVYTKENLTKVYNLRHDT